MYKKLLTRPRQIKNQRIVNILQHTQSPPEEKKRSAPNTSVGALSYEKFLSEIFTPPSGRIFFWSQFQKIFLFRSKLNLKAKFVFQKWKYFVLLHSVRTP